MYCRLCIFLEDGEVYGYFQRGTLEAKNEHNYGKAHKVELIGKFSKEEIKVMYPHASFINFKELGKHRMEREKIIELKSKPVSAAAGPPVTITITKDQHGRK